jgi:hypothetical protein
MLRLVIFEIRFLFLRTLSLVIIRLEKNNKRSEIISN